MEVNRIIQGNALDVLKKIPSDSIDCVITSPPYWCLAEGHEILTYSGWKDVSEIEVDDSVLSVNTETMELEWVKVTAVGKWYYKGKMIHFRGKGIDLLVTPNHRMFVYYKKIGVPIKEKQKDNRGRWTKSKTVGYFVEAKDVKDGYITPKIGWKWKGKNEVYFVLPELKTTYNRKEVYYPPKKIKMEDWLAFFGLWLAEGSVRGSKGGQKKVYEISIKQKEPKASKIRELLKRLPFDFKEYRKGDLVVFSITDKQLWAYLSKFGNTHTKYIPREIKELSSKQLKILLDWYLFGDGTVKHGKYADVYCYSVSEKLKDDLIEVALKIGSNISIEKDANSLHFVKRKTVKLKDVMHIIDYEGYIFGIEVEKNHTICVRRHGKVIFTGNSKRDYGEETVVEWPDGTRYQLGMEPTPYMFVDHLIEIFREVKRVLKPHGNCFVIIDDTYSGSGKGHNWIDPKHPNARNGNLDPTQFEKVAPRKSLLLVPEMFAIKMVYELGFILRQKLIWAKKVLIYKEMETVGNAMPESVKDRNTHTFEYIYHFVKGPKYYYDQLRLPYKESTIERNQYSWSNEGKWGDRSKHNPYAIKSLRVNNNNSVQLTLDSDIAKDNDYGGNFAGMGEEAEKYGSPRTRSQRKYKNTSDFTFAANLAKIRDAMREEGLPEVHPLGANAPDVIQINTEPFPEAHFATFPERLVEFLIKVGCPEQTCRKCGKPRERVVEKENLLGYNPSTTYTANTPFIHHGEGKSTLRVTHGILRHTVGWTNCGCGEGFEPGIVLDPFLGSGTTALVALKMGRRFIGIEINPKYIEIAKRRIGPLSNQKRLEV